MLSAEKIEKTQDFDRLIPLPVYSSNQDYLESYREIADKDIQVGDLATIYIGSDSYGERVSEVVRFKEGKRKGQIKYIRLNREDMKFLAYPLRCDSHLEPRLTNEDPEIINGKIYFMKPICPTCWKESYGAVRFASSSYRVVVGYAKDYRDPSF